MDIREKEKVAHFQPPGHVPRLSEKRTKNARHAKRKVYDNAQFVEATARARHFETQTWQAQAWHSVALRDNHQLVTQTSHAANQQSNLNIRFQLKLDQLTRERTNLITKVSILEARLRQAE